MGDRSLPRKRLNLKPLPSDIFLRYAGNFVELWAIAIDTERLWQPSV
jgi:hypothetical protein